VKAINRIDLWAHYTKIDLLPFHRSDSSLTSLGNQYQCIGNVPNSTVESIAAPCSRVFAFEVREDSPRTLALVRSALRRSASAESSSRRRNRWLFRPASWRHFAHTRGESSARMHDDCGGISSAIWCRAEVQGAMAAISAAMCRALKRARLRSLAGCRQAHYLVPSRWRGNLTVRGVAPWKR
jgi:hypothetical protein